MNATTKNTRKLGHAQFAALVALAQGGSCRTGGMWLGTMYPPCNVYDFLDRNVTHNHKPLVVGFKAMCGMEDRGLVEYVHGGFAITQAGRSEAKRLVQMQKLFA